MAAPILPGSTLGILGGGQLGRMFCTASRNMGYQLNVLDPDPDSPAGHIADDHVEAAYTDRDALDYMAHSCDVITTEFENVPAESMRYLARSKPVYPSAEVLEIAQNRNREKAFARKAGLKPVMLWSFATKDPKADRACKRCWRQPATSKATPIWPRPWH